MKSPQFTTFKVHIVAVNYYRLNSGINCETYTWTEPGTRQFCRDNGTMFSGYSFYLLQYFCTCLATPSRHRDINIFRSFLVLEALLHCRIVFVAKLKNCRVPSSALGTSETNFLNLFIAFLISRMWSLKFRKSTQRSELFG